MVTVNIWELTGLGLRGCTSLNLDGFCQEQVTSSGRRNVRLL